MSITAREWEEAIEYLSSLEDLEQAMFEAECTGAQWPKEVDAALERARVMKYIWYNRE